ncbi:MAG TPA: class I SAM-dependent methyltransferase, partial [Patescibacteria group bacterium]|nr:class I SAM-dependent methyltransferase [Patescibacteria group bacterium]
PEIGFQIRYLHFKKIITEHIKKNPRSILDAGSGIGSYSFFLHTQYPRAKITGGDIDKEKLSFSRKYIKLLKIKNVAFSYMDISKQKLQKNKYDLIVSIDVLEHIKNYKQVLYNFSRLLKPGGYLYIHTPHENQKRIFSFSKNWHHEDHVREGFSKSKLIREIGKLHLKVATCYQTFGPFGRFSWETNHVLLGKSFVLAGLLYPLLYAVALLDIFVVDSNGWGIALLVYKPLKK